MPAAASAGDCERRRCLFGSEATLQGVLARNGIRSRGSHLKPFLLAVAGSIVLLLGLNAISRR